MRYHDARAQLLTRHDLVADGLSDRRIRAAVADGTLIRLHRGRYVAAAAWHSQFAEGRHMLRVAAVHEQRRGGDAVLSHVSAAVAWGLPLYRLEPRLVHLSGATSDGHTLSGRPGIARHEIAVGDADRVVVDGLTCTSLARTIGDVVRTIPVEAALSMADAALRVVAWDESDRSYDEHADGVFRAEVRRHMERHRRARGVRGGRFIMGIADGRAQLPGESVSRLRLIELGFEVAGLQVPIPGPDGKTYYADFDLAGADAWGEFDGVGKYTTLAAAQGLTLEEVLLAEKRREDWIRGTTNRRMPRWGAEHITSAAALRARLAAFHVHPPR